MTSAALRLERIARALDRLTPLSAEDRAAFLSLPHQLRRLAGYKLLVSRGGEAASAWGLLSGFACRQVTLPNGERQILGIYIPGDIIGLENLLLGRADHSVQTLGPCEVALIASQDVQKVAFERPDIGRAMWLETLIDGARFREWIVSIGHRSGRERLGHLFCELAQRLDDAGLGQNGRYEFPMTQADLGDAIGMTAVHVNRIIKRLREQELIQWGRGVFTLLDPGRLKSMCGFSDIYLHRDLHV